MSKIIYQVFLRNYSKEGNFAELIKKIPDLKNLGVEFVYLLPIHPIGEKSRKGTVGSPYSIKDYLRIDEANGTLEELKELIDECHKYDIKIMLDMVFHHTSRDAVYIKDHPSWYVYKNGKLANKIGDWSDIADLELENEEVQNFLIEVLLHYTKLGVDAFRFDVASLIPTSFWEKAKKEVLKINKDMLFLGESIELSFLEYVHSINEYGATDEELFENGFDVLYSYDTFPYLKMYLKNEISIHELANRMQEQQRRNVNNGMRMHFLENHDQNRIAGDVSNEKTLVNLIYLSTFLPGYFLLYAGQEYGFKHRPDLFEKDPIIYENKNKNVFEHYRHALSLKKNLFSTFGNDYSVEALGENVIKVTVNTAKSRYIGLFNLGTVGAIIDIDKSEIKNIIDNKHYKITDNKIFIENPIIYLD